MSFNLKEFLKNYSTKQIALTVLFIILYLLWVFWLKVYWLLLGLPLIVDIFLTKKFWLSWRSKKEKQQDWIEWTESIIIAFTAIAALNVFIFNIYSVESGSMEKSLLIGDHLYVNKLSYGPRLPNTPLSLPFIQNTVPITHKKSYSEAIKWKYKRLSGFGNVERNDLVVFNFPEGDTVCLERSAESYYNILREEKTRLKTFDIMSSVELKSEKIYDSLSYLNIRNKYTITTRPTDKKDNYVKRCVGLPGDSIEIKQGVVLINQNIEQAIPELQHAYTLITNDEQINLKRLAAKNNVYQEDINWSPDRSYLTASLTSHTAQELGKTKMIDKVQQNITPEDKYNFRIFPHDTNYKWNRDNFGPIYIPQKGEQVALNLQNISLYERAIGHYENNKLYISDSSIYINGELANSYTFKMDYYFMMGDNRHTSMDSRYWGFVPEDHIIGKATLVWLALKHEKVFPLSVNFKRFFKKIE